ncbi:MAG: RluA family pseudouridine synthase [Lachnospiraceae bacterium]|jgi:23S rRNA pseudouridine955/2504/2580 synthase
MREIIIQSNESGQRLDKFLSKYLKEAPKSFLYKMLRKKNITLNGKKAEGREILQETDVIRLFLAEETIDKFSSHQIDRGSGKLQIIYEDEHILLVNKPAGMLSQKAQETDVSLVEHITGYLLDSGSLTEEKLRSFRPSVCNRLDRNTSGLVAAGKTLAGLQLLSQLFRERTIEKYYLCLVSGVITGSSHLKGYLKKDEKSNKVEIRPHAFAGAALIETAYQPVIHNERVTLLKIELLTGKPHQIRSHLASIGHPVVGDTKYGSSTVNKVFHEKYKLHYQLLHAWELVMPEFTGEFSSLSHKCFRAPLPEVFIRVLQGEGIEERIYE